VNQPIPVIKPTAVEHKSHGLIQWFSDNKFGPLVRHMHPSVRFKSFLSYTAVYISSMFQYNNPKAVSLVHCWDKVKFQLRCYAVEKSTGFI